MARTKTKVRAIKIAHCNCNKLYFFKFKVTNHLNLTIC